jgi:hypothetical protein
VCQRTGGQPLPIINTFIDNELTRIESVLPPMPRDTDFSVLDQLSLKPQSVHENHERHKMKQQLELS